jgi:ABC-2 type transport system ATP-binding protein
MSATDDTRAMVPAEPERNVLEGPVRIEVRGVEKTFRVPDHRIDSLKERATHPLRRVEYRELRAVRGISFDVHDGEFFGIVGRNGSGKSTLLKILASIYRADAGSIRMAGRLAPFIELGVGFNPELTSRENVVLNGVLMGLSRHEARRRFDSVLDFAGLREFADLKLKNYSSGMMVRLAFAVMVEADADIMLIDEVLAVGDAQFAQKCLEVFRERRRAGKTIVLVTHDMATVQAFCDRAMLIHDGELRYIGDPEEAALRYYRLNFGGEGGEGPRGARTVHDVNVKMVDAWLEDESGTRTENAEQGAPMRFNLLADARVDLDDPLFGFQVLTLDGQAVFGFAKNVDGQDRVAAGERVHIAATVDNPLLPGRYYVTCWIGRNRNQNDLALHVLRLFDFEVYGTRLGSGVVTVDAEVDAWIEGDTGE